MRNMSFALTTDQILKRTKTVTRRLGWRFLKVGELVQPVRKCQGLKPGEGIEKIGGPIRIVTIRREPLHAVARRGNLETSREGFPGMSPDEFVRMFCAHMRPCQPNWDVTRISFEYEPVTEAES